MNKSKAKRLRKELEREQRAVDRGHSVAARRIAQQQSKASKERDLRTYLGLTPRGLTPVEMAVYVDQEG